MHIIHSQKRVKTNEDESEKKEHSKVEQSKNSLKLNDGNRPSSLIQSNTAHNFASVKCFTLCFGHVYRIMDWWQCTREVEESILCPFALSHSLSLSQRYFFKCFHLNAINMRWLDSLCSRIDTNIFTYRMCAFCQLELDCLSFHLIRCTVNWQTEQ